LSADCVHSDLVTAIDIWAFITIYLHGYETLIHDLRDLRTVIRLAIHDVAPVAPNRSNIEQNGLVLSLRDDKSFFAPFVPLDRLVHG
jgi:hypothetical protein